MIREVMLFFAVVGCVGAAVDNCKSGGEYCLNHWDCCSNTCLSFLYKCSRIQKPQSSGGSVQNSPGVVFFAPPTIPTISPATGSLDSLIQAVFAPGKKEIELNSINSRVSEDTFDKDTTVGERVPVRNSPTISPETSSLDALIHSVFQAEKTGRDINSIEPRVLEDKFDISEITTSGPTTGPDTESIESLIRVIFGAARNKRQITPTDGIISEDRQDADQTTTVGPVTDAPQCLEIGAKCYVNDECCSARCHGFLHQCVT